MTKKYEITGPWGGVLKRGSFYMQTAEVKIGQYTYAEGAVRIVDARLVDKAGNMKPAVRGKGGTVPFVGEVAWSDGERLLRDLANKEAYGRE